MIKCCICGKDIDGVGNNPYPINNNVEERCCDECNWKVVIPARIDGLHSKREPSGYRE